MKRILIILCLLLISPPVFSQQDQVTVRLLGDTLIVLNIGAWENCAARFDIKTEIEGNEIRVIETDTVVQKMFCMCHFDLSTTVIGLAPGKYTVIVNRNYLRKYSYPADVMVEIGRRDIEISGGSAHPAAGRITQSPCYQPSEIGRSERPAPRTELTLFPNPLHGGIGDPVARFTTSVEGGIVLELYDPLGRRLGTVSREILPPGTHERRVQASLFRDSGLFLLVLTTRDTRVVAPVVCVSPYHRR